MSKINCDFLVIGTGLAGLYSAVYASKFGKVALLSKSALEFSNTYYAQGGVAAVIDPSDSPEYHFEDTLKAGRFLNDKMAVEILVEEGAQRVKELISMGMKFDEADGEIELGLEGGHSKRRVLHAGGDATGLKLIEFFADLVRRNPNIQLYENTVVYELVGIDNTCYGARTFNYAANEFDTFISPGTILATGGASGIFKRSTNPYTTTGDGIVLAYDVGASLADMEFIQFHPSAFHSATGETFLISEAVRGEGAHLVNHEGKRFLLDYHEKAELAPRDIVSMAIYKEMKRSGKENVFLKLNHLDEKKIINRFSNICKEVKKFGLDLANDLIPVSPAAHYMVGGVKSDYNSATNINRLFVCGEVSSTGVHGANRLASNSLLECLVFGKRAVDSVNNLSPNDVIKSEDISENKIDIKSENEKLLIDVKTKLAEVMNENAGIVRSKKSLYKALRKFGDIKQKNNLDEKENYCIKLSSLLKLCELMVKSALTREDSIGGHYREDFPNEAECKYHTTANNKTGITKIEMES